MKHKTGLEKLLVNQATGELIRAKGNHMIEPPLQKIIDDCCDRNEIRGDHRAEVQAQCETIWVLMGLFELLEKGEMEICGIKDGELQWKSTPHGKAEARRIIGESQGG